VTGQCQDAEQGTARASAADLNLGGGQLIASLVTGCPRRPGTDAAAR
jgi:hypothetical protein